MMDLKGCDEFEGMEWEGLDEGCCSVQASGLLMTIKEFFISTSSNECNKVACPAYHRRINGIQRNSPSPRFVSFATMQLQH
jgi:hypothetical protein